MINEQLEEAIGIETKSYSGKWEGVTLEEVRDGWNEYQASARGDAVYIYLHMVFEQVRWWLLLPLKRQEALRAVQEENPQLRFPGDLYATAIMVTADPQKVDAKQRSKWARALRYAAEYKPPNEWLRDFLQRRGGINKCADRYARHIGRQRDRKSKMRDRSRSPQV
jgi:hypothetical protein